MKVAPKGMSTYSLALIEKTFWRKVSWDDIIDFIFSLQMQYKDNPSLIGLFNEIKSHADFEELVTAENIKADKEKRPRRSLNSKVFCFEWTPILVQPSEQKFIPLDDKDTRMIAHLDSIVYPDSEKANYLVSGMFLRKAEYKAMLKEQQEFYEMLSEKTDFVVKF